MIFQKFIKTAFKHKEGYILGKYFKAEWKYFLETKMYIYYSIWLGSSIITILLGRLQYGQYSSHYSGDVPLAVIISLLSAFLSLASFIAPLFILLLYAQSITSAFTEGAYRNVFTLNISRVKWLASKALIYLTAYLCVIITIKIFNELIILTYPHDFVGIQGVSSIFVYKNLFVTFLMLLIELSFILVFHGFVTWLAISLRKTVPVALIMVFGTIAIQIMAGIILAIILSFSFNHGGVMLFSYPLPGDFSGLIALAELDTKPGVAYLNLGLTIVFQLGYAALFYFLGYRKINRLDF